MLVPVVIAVIAFPAGIYLSRRAVPALAASPTGYLATRVSDCLVGAATAALALNIYLAIRVATTDQFDQLSRVEPITYAITDALWQAGLLMAAAAGVHLLGPGGDDVVEPAANPDSD
jgi:hypothetical protein